MQTVVDALGRQGIEVRGTSARCPAHDDNSPSLSITKGDRQAVILKCHAGCDTDDIVSTLGLTMADLCDPATRPKASSLGDPIARYSYTDADGTVIYEVVRYASKRFRQRRPDGRGGWTWSLKGVDRVLYRLPQVVAAVAAGETVYIVEGERDVETLERAGVVATCNSGGAGKFEPRHAAVLSGADVVIVADNDPAGHRHAAQVDHLVRAAGARSVRVVRAATGNDVTDHLAAGHTIDELVDLDLDDEVDTPAEQVDESAVDGPAVLPAEVWTSRTELAAVAQAAHARLVAPDAVLGAVLARIAVAVPHTLKVPGIVGGAVGLTSYVVAVGPPGTGKSAGARVAADLIPLGHDVPVAPIGSGEGLVELLHEVVDDEVDGRTHKVKRQTRYRALVTVDEGSALGELGARKGSTLLSTLRSAWTDAPIGSANASAERRRIIPAGQATYGVLIGMQPAKAGPLLDDVDAGTPQRCIWLAADHPDPPDTIPTWPSWSWSPPSAGAIDRLPLAGGTYRHRAVVVDEAVVAEVVEHRRAVQARRVQVDPWRAHDHLLRLKVSTLLALLGGRLEVTVDDWRLAGIIVDTSAAVRGYCIDAVAQLAGERERVTRGNLVGRDQAIEDNRRAQALERAADTIARKVRRLGTATRRDAQQAMSSAHRALVSIDEVLDHAVGLGLIIETDDGYGPSRRSA